VKQMGLAAPRSNFYFIYSIATIMGCFIIIILSFTLSDTLC